MCLETSHLLYSNDHSLEEAPLTACVGEFQATTMLREYIDPLAWTFYMQYRPRLPRKRLSLVLSLIRALYLILACGGIMYDLVHLDPIHMHHADRASRGAQLRPYPSVQLLLKRTCYSEKL